MLTILVIGRGHIGTLIAECLHHNHHRVVSADITVPSSQSCGHRQIKFDVNNPENWKTLLKTYTIDAIVSALPFHCNTTVIDQAKRINCHYFDLTESEVVTQYCKQQSRNQNKAYVPQCGIAPGLINIIAHDLLKKIDSPTDIEIKVGALPQKKSGHSQLNYAHIWSLEGLIEEYSQPATLIMNGKKTQQPPLEGYEQIRLFNQSFEAFNTSGGIGSLIDNLPQSIRSCHYKTLRYPGHLNGIKLLMQEMHLKDDPQALYQLFKKNLPHTLKDYVVCHVALHKSLSQKTISHSWSKIFYPCEWYGKTRTAIQLSTALSACAMVEIVLGSPTMYQGYIEHHRFTPQQIANTPYGKYLN